MSPVDERSSQTTRKQRREQARAQRRQIEAAQTAQGAQRRRAYQLAGAAFVVAAIIAIVLLVTSGAGSRKAPAPSSRVASQAATEVVSLLGGIAQSGNTLGSVNAPVTMQYFGDLECPVCRQFTLGALPALIERDVRASKLKIQYRSLETATRDSGVFRAQQAAALAAGKQDKMWNYVELFYREQGEEGSGYVTESYLQGLAQQVPGLSLSVWSAARSEASYQRQIASDAQAASQHGFDGTPSFLIGRSGGTLRVYSYTSLTDPSGFEAAIEEALRR